MTSYCKRLPTDGHRQRGIALVVVLWVTVLLTVIVSSFVYSVRSHVQLTGIRQSREQAAALADAGVYRAVYELLKPISDGNRWKADGSFYDFEMGGGKVEVSMVSADAFIDLNAAPERLLLSLFTSVGVEAGKAQALVDAIEDWRDPDDLPRLSGAERDQYLAAGLKQVPANADFRTVDELKAVYGMTPAIFDKVKGALTVYSKVGGFDSRVAPRQVLLAIPKVSQDQVEQYLADRKERLAAGEPAAPFPPAAAFAGSSRGVYNVRSVAALPDGTEFVRTAVVRLTGVMQRPFAFLAWGEGSP